VPGTPVVPSNTLGQDTEAKVGGVVVVVVATARLIAIGRRQRTPTRSLNPRPPLPQLVQAMVQGPRRCRIA